MEEFATLGDTGIAFDPHQHGELMVAGVDESLKRVRSNICRDFWPILAQTAREVPLVIYWSLEKFDLENQVGLGGISMGGDVSIIACDLDQRIELAVPWIATPDWLRPGTCESVGAPDEKAQADYDELNPLTLTSTATPTAHASSSKTVPRTRKSRPIAQYNSATPYGKAIIKTAPSASRSSCIRT